MDGCFGGGRVVTDHQLLFRLMNHQVIHKTVYNIICLGQSIKAYYLTATGVMAEMKEGFNRILLFLSAAVGHTEEMPQCAIRTPRGHAQDLGNSRSATPLAQTTG